MDPSPSIRDRAFSQTDQAYAGDDPVNQSDPTGLCPSDLATETASRNNRFQTCTLKDGGTKFFPMRNGTISIRQNPVTGTINIGFNTSALVNEVLDNDFIVSGYISTNTGQESYYSPHGRQFYHTTIAHVPGHAILTIQFYGNSPFGGGFAVGFSCLTVSFGTAA